MAAATRRCSNGCTTVTGSSWERGKNIVMVSNTSGMPKVLKMKIRQIKRREIS
jgi:hypothetical protein